MGVSAGPAVSSPSFKIALVVLVVGFWRGGLDVVSLRGCFQACPGMVARGLFLGGRFGAGLVLRWACPFCYCVFGGWRRVSTAGIFLVLSRWVMVMLCPNGCVLVVLVNLGVLLLFGV